MEIIFSNFILASPYTHFQPTNRLTFYTWIRIIDSYVPAGICRHMSVTQLHC